MKLQLSLEVCMHPFAMETAAILVHSLNRLSLCTKMAAVAVAKLLLCCDIMCKHGLWTGSVVILFFTLQVTLGSYNLSA